MIYTFEENYDKYWLLRNSFELEHVGSDFISILHRFELSGFFHIFTRSRMFTKFWANNGKFSNSFNFYSINGGNFCNFYNKMELWNPKIFDEIPKICCFFTWKDLIFCFFIFVKKWILSLRKKFNYIIILLIFIDICHRRNYFCVLWTSSWSSKCRFWGPPKPTALPCSTFRYFFLGLPLVLLGLS